MSGGSVGDGDGEDCCLDGSLRIPKVACTRDAFLRYLPLLRVRDLLAWALRTVAGVRLSKIDRRVRSAPSTSSDNGSSGEGGGSFSQTLDSDYLIDVYPAKNDFKSDYSDPMGREAYKFCRKAAPQIDFLEVDSEDFDGLTAIEIRDSAATDGGDGFDGHVHHFDFDGRAAVPPTLLHFEIIIEAYMGYSLGSGVYPSYYNSPHSYLPRAAVMGGAVVAALAAYKDKSVVDLFVGSELFDENDGGKLAEVGKYRAAKKDLIGRLHDHFTHKETPVWTTPCSKFSKGDVDVFLQASPMTRGVLSDLIGHSIGPDQIDMISSYIGRNAGLCEEDLERYAMKVIENRHGGSGAAIKTPEGTQFAFALSKHALSFILGLENVWDNGDAWDDPADLKDMLWPRTTQFIMLDPRVDLLGGLLDFDQSVVTCSFDGVSVRVAPRAALSLMTNANFVTPFCLEEQRNKSRVIKYASRGFRPFLIDPHDTDACQNVECNAVVSRKPFFLKDVEWRMSHYNDEYNEIIRIQEEKMESQDRIFCCHVHGRASDWFRGELLHLGHDLRGLHRHYGVPYTMKLFEKSPDDAIDFFQKRFHWSDEDRRKVNAIDPYMRVACRKCKNEYNLIRVVMPQCPELMKEYNLQEDSLRGRFSYQHTDGGNQWVEYSPSFYAGGVFDSARARGNAAPAPKILSKLHAQSIFEVSAYVMKHGSPENYLKRFVHGSDLNVVFEKARKMTLRAAARPPIGLNPERFIERCEQCQKWLIGNKYRLKYCKHCSGVKRQKVATACKG